MPTFNIRAVVVGSLLMLALDILSSILLFSVFGGDALSSGATQEEITAVSNIVAQNDGYLLAGMFLGSFSTVLGAYIAARIANNLPLFIALAVGVVGIVVAALLGDGSNESPMWFSAFGYISTVPMALVGGWLARRESKPGP